VPETQPRAPGRPPRKAHAVVDAGQCLGCGVCRRPCKTAALHLRRRETRVYTPESQLERILRQALERGRLQYVLFDDPSRLSHRVLGTVFGWVLDLPQTQRLLAREQLKSRFVHLLLDATKARASGLGSRKSEARSLKPEA